MKKLYVILSLLISLNSTAQDCSRQEAVIEAARAYVEVLEETIVNQGTVIVKLEANNAQISADLEELQQRQTAWYNSPWLMLAVGVVAGVAVSK